MFLRYVTSTTTDSGRQINFNNNGTIDFWSFGNGTWTQTGALVVRYKSATVSIPVINANGGTTIEITNWSDASPYTIQFLDSSQARPIIATNWWVNGAKLSVQVTNTSSSTSDAKNMSMRTLIVN